MPINVNPPYRLHQILSRAANTQLDAQQTLYVWSEIFSVNDTDPPRREILAVKGLGLLLQELEMSSAIMARSPLSKSLYQGALDAAHHAISISCQAQPWSHVRGHINPQTLRSLHWCSEVSPMEEDLIEADDIKQLLTELDELETDIKTSGLPEPLQQLVLRHIEEIRDALRWYPITGEKGLEEALHKACGEMHTSAATVTNVQLDQPQVQKWMKIWIKFMVFIKRAEGAFEAVNRLQKLYEKARPLIECIQTYISPTGGSGPNPPNVI